MWVNLVDFPTIHLSDELLATQKAFDLQGVASCIVVGKNNLVHGNLLAHSVKCVVLFKLSAVLLCNALSSECVLLASAFFIKVFKLCLSSLKNLDFVSLFNFNNVLFKSCHGCCPPLFSLYYISL